MTAEEYLRIERAAVEDRSDYVDGEMIPRAVSSIRHVLIASNLVCELSTLLRQAPCLAFTANFRVATDPLRHYTYPDVGVACEPLRLLDANEDTLLNPTFLVEVLSDENENYDRGPKFERYRGVESLAQYMLVSQDRVHIELYTRQPNGEWTLRESNDLDAEIELNSLSCRLKIAEVYLEVRFDEAG